ncbi:structural maintenance of chromosomes protein 6 isoform X2 [Phlebotomus argentipes]|uniref:structural maintenance of chromosomes protein 6 isoform X2 n=1 Tax=Phlebotomus argentipes TaxID=94469 RepID=UPI002892C3A4|nr:structural maintenance of chromosomes protein 6 isoform X2 [Phlebotomus argentipes]
MPKRRGKAISSATSAKKLLLDNDKTENVERLLTVDSKDVDNDVCSGKILYIHLKNFMCHGNLRVDLNRRCNLIVGNNGSGKSAILTAVIIGLGGRAAVANRSTNIKHLVKRDQASCTIEIGISNDGIDAYDKETFGNRIIVMRKITASGQSTYKISNESGQEISRDRHYLERLLCYFNIQIDNPVCILHQDAARSFLKDCNPQKMYTFYMKATQLQQIMDRLHQCLTVYRNNKTEYDMILEKIMEDIKHVDELKEKHKELSSVATTKVLIGQLRKELIWIKYNDQRALYLKADGELKDVRDTVQKLENIMATSSSRVDEIRRRMQSIREEQQLKKQLLTQITAQYEQMQQQYLEEKDAENVQKKSYEVQRQKTQRIEGNIAKVQERLANDNFEEKVAQLKRENEQKLARLRDEHMEMQAISSSLDRDTDDVRRLIDENAEAFNAAQQQKIHFESQLKKISQECLQLDIESQDGLGVYGGYMAHLLKVIEAAHKRREFSKLPRGPFGRYIEVPSAKFRTIAENIIGGYITSFMVNSHSDRKVLENIMKKIIPGGKTPSVIVTAFVNDVYNYSAGKCNAPPGTHTLVDVLRVSDANVMNALINSLSIESVLLTEDEDLAVRLTDGSNIPKNLKKVILVKPFQEYLVKPFRMYSLQERPGRYIQVNLKDVKENLLKREKSLMEEFKIVEKKYKKVSTEKHNLEVLIQEKITEKRKLIDKLKRLESSIKEIENTVYPTEDENEALKEEHVTLTNALDKALKLMKREKEQLLQVREKLEELLKQKEKIKSDEVEVSHSIKDLDAEHDKENDKIASVEYNCRESESKLAQKKEIAVYLSKELEKLQKTMDTALQRAEKTGARIETTRSEETVNDLIKKGQANIVHLEKLHGSLEELTEQIECAIGRLEKDQKVGEILKDTLEKMKLMQYKRHQTVSRMKLHVYGLVRHHFSKLLELRGFAGDLTVDYESQELRLKVIPRDNHISTAMDSTQSLSGGERSFTTVSLLLSLWNCVNHPFFLLDEYDVFTDPINRQYMTNLLVRHTEKHPYTQYAFLTPQDMSSLEGTPTRTIFRMTDPSPDLQ